METLLPPAYGLLAGLILGLTGAGGGIIAVPLLVFGLHLPIQQAGPVGLLAVGIAAAIGAGMGLRQGIVRYRAAALIGGCGILTAPLGVWLAARLPNPPLLLAFAALLCWTSWRMLRHSRPAAVARPLPDQRCRRSPADGRFLWTPPCARVLAATGLFSGLLSGLLGVGGGFFIVPALTRHTDLTPQGVLATSLGVMTLVAAGSVAAAAWQGSLDWELARLFALGTCTGLLLARHLASRISGRRLQQAFAALCGVVAAMMLARAGGWLLPG